MTARPSLAVVIVVALAIAVVAVVRRRAMRSAAGREFFRHPAATPALMVLTFLVLAAVGANFVAPYDPSAMPDVVALKNQPPSWAHPLGTNLYSQDTWSRLLFGARISLMVGALATLVAVTVGALAGATAGYFRRWVDAVLMRVVDVGLALPRMFLLLMIAALWEGLPLPILVVLIGLTGWFGTSRIVRAEVLSLRERDFVAAARALGARAPRVIFRHVLPNAAAPIIVSAALGVGNVLLLEAGLSFLGIGVRPPLPSWGNMIGDGWSQAAVAPWATLFPGLAIALVVMACHAIGDALRDALDPRQEAT